MGWNDIRISFIPRGRRLIARADSRAQTVAHRPLQILETEVEPGSTPPVVGARDARTYLEEQGFQLTQESPESLTLTRDDVDIFLAIEGEALAELLLTLRLGPHSPDRLASWQELAANLHAKLFLQSTDRVTQELTHSDDFLAQVIADSNWLAAADRYHWSPSDNLFDAMRPTEAPRVLRLGLEQRTRTRPPGGGSG